MSKDAIRFTDLFRYWRDLPHQRAAMAILAEQIPAAALSRESEWFKVWSQAGKQPDPNWLAPAEAIIKEFEGNELRSYKCPAGVWTIGYGHSGVDVVPGLTWTQQQADTTLRFELLNDWGPAVVKMLPMATSWTPNRVAAIVSWTFNVGTEAAKGSTLVERITGGEDPTVVVREELPRWCKANGKALPGLLRRRQAEVALFMGGEPQPKGNPLSVPWFSQLDSATDQAARMCFSSSCAMLTAFLRPGSLLGPNGDDQYLQTVQSYGDSTDPQAQLKALASYGIKAEFTINADFALIEKQINAGIPVPCGYLHRGSVANPSGGHWLIVVGYTEKHVIVHDPYGEADLIYGTTVNAVARFCKYSRENFGKRWIVEGPGSGWAIIAQP